MGPAKSTQAIENLLDEKDRIEQWLNRLERATDETPAHVRARVEQDYRARLTDVMGELHGHRDELEASHARFAEQRAELAKEETAASERLAEAELRHSVGEYDEGKWNSLKTEILEALVKTRESLQQVEHEIGGLEGVLALLQSPPDRAADRGEERPVPAAADVEIVTSADPGLPVPQGDAFDDAGVLRLDDEDAQVPGVTDARGEFQTVSDGSTPEAGRARDRRVVVSQDAEEVPIEVGASGTIKTPDGDGSAPTGSTTKTLTCEECGTANLPTEWYCERCGAELDAV